MRAGAKKKMARTGPAPDSLRRAAAAAARASGEDTSLRSEKQSARSAPKEEAADAENLLQSRIALFQALAQEPSKGSWPR